MLSAISYLLIARFSMPQGGAARKSDNSSSTKRRSSSNSAKRQNFGVQQPANDNNILIPANDNSAIAPSISTLRGIGPSSPKLSPRPTGSASASAIKPRSSRNKSRSVGPQAIARPVNPAQIAARLNSDQQQSRRDQTPGSGPTREEMLAGSGGGGDVLSGQYDPLEGSSAYGRESTAPPGSMAETPEIDTERGGGQMGSDLERQRAMQLQQGKMAAVRQSAGDTGSATGLPSLSGTTAQTKTTEEQPPAQGTVAEAAGKAFPMGRESQGKDSEQLDKAQQLAQAVGAERTAKVIQTAQNVKGNLEALRKAQKTLKNFWNLIKAGELAASVSIASLVLLIVTANLQMINKYTFKNNLIPETYFVEDGAIVCTDCGLCGASCISVFVMPMVLIPFIAAVIVMGGVFGLDYFGVIDMTGLMSGLF